MTFDFNSDNGESYIFDPESFMVPPIEGFLRRMFGARWGLVLVSSPEELDVDPIMDYLADYSLQLAFYSEFSTEREEFEGLQRAEPVLKSIDEVVEEATEAVPSSETEPAEVGEVEHVPRNPEIVFVPVLDSSNVGVSVEAAMSGRLVFAGIHAEGSFPALQEFRRLTGSDHLTAASLMGILGLNAVRRICEECKTQYQIELNKEECFLLGCNPGTLTIFRGQGCEHCENTGYKDRILISEGFELSENIRTEILNGTAPRQLRLIAKKEGMHTLLDSTWELVEAGETTLDEVSRIADNTDPGRAD